MDPNALFRKAALDKLASPERLDVLVRVTSPTGWLALLTLGAVIVGVVIWGIVGSIPDRIDGQGILLRGGSIRDRSHRPRVRADRAAAHRCDGLYGYLDPDAARRATRRVRPALGPPRYARPCA